MRPGGGKSKGASFERKVAEMIRDAGAHLGFKKEDVYRTPASGGHWASKGMHPSDLVLKKRVRKYFPYAVECKHIKKFAFHWFLTREGPIYEWIDQVTKAMKDDKTINVRMPMVVFTWNRAPVFCIVKSSHVTEHLGHKVTFVYKDATWHVVKFKVILKILLKDKVHEGNTKGN